MTLFGQLLLIAGLMLLVRAWWEPTKLDSCNVRMQSSRPVAPGSVQPPKPLRILLLSDLHAEFFRLPEELLLSSCARARPDLILFAGDLAGRPSCLPAALDLMRRIHTLPELENTPFFAVRGNHDSAAAASGLQQIGIQVLENDFVPVVLFQKTWLVIGLQDKKTASPDASSALKFAEGAGIPPEQRIVLAHNPDTLLDIPKGSIGFFLAGHFHGGQIWLPFGLEFFLLRNEKLPRIGHFKGSFIWQGTPAYISRGLGCVSLPLRLFSRPELTLLEIS